MATKKTTEPFDRPKNGRTAVQVIIQLGVQVMKVIGVA